MQAPLLDMNRGMEVYVVVSVLAPGAQHLDLYEVTNLPRPLV